MMNEVPSFEQPIVAILDNIATLQAQIELEGSNANLKNEIDKLSKKRDELTKKIYSNLTDWQVSQISRHAYRPYTLDYIERVFTDFDEFHGDRAYADDKAIIGGTARIDGRTVMIIGHQKARDTKGKLYRNWGMPAPEGYRKALRLMEMAQRFKMPIITFIDTPGAYPGVGAEERGQAEAIARNLREMSRLQVPIICNIIGEGGSGGALALGVGDKVNMLQFSTYSVISPEGCASILWKTRDKAETAADAMNITAQKLIKLSLIDSIIPEPLGGAHRNYDEIAANMKLELTRQLTELGAFSIDELLERRFERLMNYGYIR